MKQGLLVQSEKLRIDYQGIVNPFFIHHSHDFLYYYNISINAASLVSI